MDVVYATETASVMVDGAMHSVFKGTHWSAADPIVRANPSLFSDNPCYGLSYSTPPPEMYAPPVEAATAVPGEKRSTRTARN